MTSAGRRFGPVQVYIPRKSAVYICARTRMYAEIRGSSTRVRAKFPARITAPARARWGNRRGSSHGAPPGSAARAIVRERFWRPCAAERAPRAALQNIAAIA